MFLVMGTRVNLNASLSQRRIRLLVLVVSWIRLGLGFVFRLYIGLDNLDYFAAVPKHWQAVPLFHPLSCKAQLE